MLEMKVLHIAGGLLAIGAGAVALYALKGAELHRKAGIAFVCAMIAMSATGALLATLKGERPNVMGGMLTFYMVTTAFVTVRRRAYRFHWLDAAGMLFALAVGIYEISLGVEAVNSPRGRVDGLPAPPVFAIGVVALLAALGDLRMMLARGVQGARRLARHLWRMCFAMFIATGSFFLGQPQIFPQPIRIVPLLAIPVLLVLSLMFYWLVRVRVMKRLPRARRDGGLDYPPAERSA